MPQTTPPINPNFIAAAWPHLPHLLRLRLYLITWLALNPPPRIICLPIIISTITFLSLVYLPLTPKSLFIAPTLALCLAIPIYAILTRLYPGRNCYEK